jgi:hypothetical protein
VREHEITVASVRTHPGGIIQLTDFRDLPNALQKSVVRWIIARHLLVLTNNTAARR